MTAERSVGRPWTAQEDELLVRAVAEHGENDNWKRVAMCIPGRTNKACRKRWLHSLSPDVKKTAWTPEEDRRLLELYALHAGKWAAIAKQIPGRTDDACSKRYREALDPQLKKGDWSAEEDAQLLEAYKQLGGRWGQVGQQLQRSGLGCRNRWRLLERKRSTSHKQDLSLDFNMQQPQPQQPYWENNMPVPVAAPFQYTSSSLSTALFDPVTQQYSDYPPSSMSSASSSAYVNLPSTSTSPASHSMEFAATAMYEENARQFDQLHRHTPVSVSDDYYITPATHEDRRMSHHQHSFPLQHPDHIHSSLQRSDLFYHSYPPRDQPCDNTMVLHQPRAQYYDQLHTDQLSLSSRPPTSTQHSLHYAQQQSDQLVRCTSPSTPQQDLAPSTEPFYPPTSPPHNSLVHRSTPSLPKSSLSSPYPKQPPQLDTSQPVQGEPNPSIIRARQRVRQTAPRKRPDAQAPLRLSSDLPATSDPSIRPYACGHESCWPAHASTSLACYSTSRGLSDHTKAEHLDDVGGDRPYRCGLEGCGKSWKSINGLQYHLQISKAHFQHAITNTYLVAYIGGLSVPASVEASAATQSGTKKKQYSCLHKNCPNRYKQLSGLRYHLAHVSCPAILRSCPSSLTLYRLR
ncbi:hypothetical protein J3A83DRAFT_3553486 [Scleroderma citrinum]